MCWPKYEELYVAAFERMLEARRAKGKPCDWQTGRDVFHWWMEDKNVAGQLSMFDEEGDQ
jgi:phosphoadenosine phosphosulfate reductase